MDITRSPHYEFTRTDPESGKTTTRLITEEEMSDALFSAVGKLQKIRTPALTIRGLISEYEAALSIYYKYCEILGKEASTLPDPEDLRSLLVEFGV